MRSTLLGLTVPVLLIAAAFAAVAVTPAAAQATTYTISGRVLADDGTPLEGVQVRGWSYHEDPTRSSVAANDDDVTDADGSYELTLAAGKGSINIYYEKWRQSDYRDLAVESDQTIDFTLKTPPPKTAKIVGTVLDAAGNPVSGATVQLGYGCCIAYAEPAVAEGSSSGGGSAGSAGTESANATTTEAAPATEPSPAPSSDEKVASDVAMTRPMIMPPYYDDYATTTTGADGTFQFDAYAGPRQITAWAKGFAQTTVQIEAKDGETTEVQVVLEKVPERSAILEGRVIDAKSGAPIKGAQVNVRSLEWGRYAYAETDSDGNYRIQTVPGWTEVSVSWWPRYDSPVAVDMVIAPRALETTYYPYMAVIDLTAGETDHTAKLDPKPKPTVVLTGYVLDPDAKTGVEGAHVSVWNQETGDWGEAITDKTGSYRILVREGHHTASVWKEGYLSGTQSFAVEGASERVDLVLPKGTTKYAPCVDDSDCGYPIYYAEKGVAEMDARTAATSASAPPAAPQPGGLDGAGDLATAESASLSADSSSRGAATYSGEGGGLPPYDPNAAVVDAEDGETTTQPVPGLGLVAALGVLALAAIALGRRRS